MVCMRANCPRISDPAFIGLFKRLCLDPEGKVANPHRSVNPDLSAAALKNLLTLVQVLFPVILL